MRPAPVVVLNPFGENRSEMALVQWDDKIDAFAANCADHPSTESIGPRPISDSRALSAESTPEPRTVPAVFPEAATFVATAVAPSLGANSQESSGSPRRDISPKTESTGTAAPGQASNRRQVAAA